MEKSIYIYLYLIFPLLRRYDAVLLKALFAIGLLGNLGNLFLNTSRYL